MANPTRKIEPVSDRPTVSARIETALADEIERRIGPGTDVTTFWEEGARETEGEGGNWWHVQANRGPENPENSGIFQYIGQIISRGATQPELEQVETMMASGEVFSSVVAHLAEPYDSGFAVPKGDLAEVEPIAKSGTNQDQEYRYRFSIWAQAAEITKAAQAA